MFKLDTLVARPSGDAVPLIPLTEETFAVWRAKQNKALATWVETNGFNGQPGRFCLLPAGDGRLQSVLIGLTGAGELWDFGALPSALPRGDYALKGGGKALAELAALGWALGSYRFTKYKPASKDLARLVWPDGADRAAVRGTATAVALVRDLINTPAADMGPAELAAAARTLARTHGARASVVVGNALLQKNYPASHAVGRAAAQAPRLIDLRWSGPRSAKAPLITLVGKGVCFDTGGLDLKTAAGMKLMKKDMGGAAHVLGLAAMIMAAKLPLRLRVLVPAVENAVSGNAFRPLDVLQTRKGLTVEVGNTDAEGRLVLCDALTEAVSEKPDLIVDFATLTGAARVALGTELPALFCNHEATAERLLKLGIAQADPLWRLPLHQPYRRLVESKVADLNNAPAGGYGGAITAALFLQAFVPDEIPWVHIDLMAWNISSRPGRPEGGEAMALRATYALIAELAGKAGDKKTAAGRGRRGK